MNYSEFLERFNEVVNASGWRVVRGPAQLVEQWEAFVAACEAGYSDTVYDYENERSVCDLLDSALRDPVLCRYEELAVLQRAVEAVDARFERCVVLTSSSALQTSHGGGDACQSSLKATSLRTW